MRACTCVGYFFIDMKVYSFLMNLSHVKVLVRLRSWSILSVLFAASTSPVWFLCYGSHFLTLASFIPPYVSLCLLFCLSVIFFRLCLHALFSVPLSASIIVPLSVSLSLPHYPPHCLLDCLALCAFVKSRQHRTIVCVRFCLIPCLHRVIRVKWRTGCEWMLACPVWYSSCSSSDGYSAGGSVTCQAKEAVVRSDWPMCIH